MTIDIVDRGKPEPADEVSTVDRGAAYHFGVRSAMVLATDPRVCEHGQARSPDHLPEMPSTVQAAPRNHAARFATNLPSLSDRNSVHRGRRGFGSAGR